MSSNILVKQTYELLQEIEPTPFEHFIGDLFEYVGWDTEVTKQSGDGGVDVIASRKGLPCSENWKIFIQARRYTTNQIQPNTVTDSLRKIQYHYGMPDRVLIISTGECTAQARQTVKRLSSVGVVDVRDLSRFVLQTGALDLLDQYPEIDSETLI